MKQPKGSVREWVLGVPGVRSARMNRVELALTETLAQAAGWGGVLIWGFSS